MVVASVGFQVVKIRVAKWSKLCTFRFQNGVGDTVGDTVGGTSIIWFAPHTDKKTAKNGSF